MIDSKDESLLTLAQAADELPRRRRGRKTHVSTLFRWSTAGCKGRRPGDDPDRRNPLHEPGGAPAVLRAPYRAASPVAAGNATSIGPSLRRPPPPKPANEPGRSWRHSGRSGGRRHGSTVRPTDRTRPARADPLLRPRNGKSRGVHGSSAPANHPTQSRERRVTMHPKRSGRNEEQDNGPDRSGRGERLPVRRRWLRRHVPSRETVPGAKRREGSRPRAIRSRSPRHQRSRTPSTSAGSASGGSPAPPSASTRSSRRSRSASPRRSGSSGPIPTGPTGSRRPSWS